ncbi:MAG: hypothetical protein ACE5HK_08145 [Candidatus Methylomirabilales bacterium]
MKVRAVGVALLIASLVLGGMVLPAEARGGHHGHHGHHHGHGHFFGGFLAGAATVLILDALHRPRVIHHHPVCRDIWIEGHWEVQPREQNGFISYYQVWVPSYWQRQCY